MEIIIDIPEEDYEYIKKSKDYNFNAIKNGTPLPKGHGRLIDESKITKCYMPVNQFDVRGIRTDAPTIIEADKESEE